MKKEITDDQLIDFIEGNYDEAIADKIKMDRDLQQRLDALKEVIGLMQNTQEVEVPSHIGSNLNAAMLREELKNNKGNRPWMQIAAAIAFLVVGFALGKLGQGDQSMELASLKNEIQSLREVTLTSTLQKHSASERIMAVNRIEETNEFNPSLISTLVSTLNSDESQSVRYAALQALKRFQEHEEVRAELVKSLEAQTDPLIQISLISILVEAEERSAIAPLRKMMKDQEVMPEVKQQADIAIQVLT